MRRPKKQQRGFALIIIVLLVALLALTGATLLDLVTVDLTIAGQHRKVVRAQMVADGAIREVLSDEQTMNRRPDFSSCGTGGGACPNYRYTWAAEQAGQVWKDPDNLYNRQPLDETTSVLAKWTGSPSEEHYTASVDILRTAPLFDSGASTFWAYIYEINADAQVAGGDANHVLHAQGYTVQGLQNGLLLPRRHRR